MQNATVQVAINENDPVNVTVASDLVSSGKFVRCFKLLHQGKNTLVFTVTPPEGSEVEATTYTVNLNLRPSLHEMSVTATGVTSASPLTVSRAAPSLPALWSLPPR